jgi:hypothetical protein
MKHVALVCLGLGLLVSGCGEQLNSEAQKTIGGFKHEVQHGITIDETPLQAF